MSSPPVPPSPVGASSRCPCLSGLTYGECCRRLHDGEVLAPTAQRLMSSRYSAFAVGDADYLLTTWHPSTKPATLDLDRDVQWVRLDLVASTGGGPLDSDGVVEFTAHFRLDGQRHQQHETSRFVRLERRWLYLDSLG